MAISLAIKRSLILSCGAVVAGIALKRSLESAQRSDKAHISHGAKESLASKPSNIRKYWCTIFRLLRLHRDVHAMRILTSMLGCAFVFSVVDVRKAFVSGQLFRTVFEGDSSRFRRLLALNVGLCLVLTVFNKVLANLVSSLGRHWHVQLVRKIHDLYFAGNNYYRIQNLIELPHERIATDAPQLTRDLALISCDVVNAIINFAVFSRQVFIFGKRIAGDKSWGGARFVLGPVGYAVIGSVIVARFAPNLGILKKRQRELESKYKQSHVRLCRNAEAVAIYSGEEYEERVVDKHFTNLADFNENARWAGLPSELIKEYVTKYALHTCMMLLILSPFFNPTDPSKGKSAGQTMYRLRVLSDLIVMELIALSQIARLGNTVQRVSGLVDRVGELVSELEKVDSSARAPDVRGTTSDKSIVFEDVTIITPAGHRLVSGLSFTIKPGENFLICGPNGAGKSSILRCLGGLWPIEAGKILRPSGNSSGLHADAFYLPQRPYIPAFSTLSQCISYPEMDAKIDDVQLSALLRLVELDYLYVQMKSSDSLQDVFTWDIRLSLGEQQRLAIARLFFHRPVYAVLDECTSGVSLKMERRLFKLCKELGITLITISHRPALQDFHQRMLVLDGAGGYQIHDLPSKQEGNLQHSISTRSLADLNTMLGHYPFDKIVSRLERSGSLVHFNKLGEAANENESLKVVSRSKTRSGNGDEIDATKLWRSSIYLLRTCWNSRDMSRAGLILAIVIVRTFISNSLAGISGDSFRYLLKGKHSQFVTVIATALLMGFLQALFIPMLDVLEGDLSEAWKVRVTRTIMARYLKNKNFYRLATCAGDVPPNMVSSAPSRDKVLPDQIIVDDVDILTKSIANLWGECAKPTVDFLWFARSVYALTGWKGLGSLAIYMVGGSGFLSFIRPDLAELSATKEQLDGEFLTVHARLSQCSESISFLEGGKAERKIIEKYFGNKIEHQVVQKRVEHIFGVSDQFVSYFLPQSASWILSMMYKRAHAEATGDVLIRDLRYLGSVVNQCFSSLGVLVQLGSFWASTRGHLNRVASLVDHLEFSRSDGDEILGNPTNRGLIQLSHVDVVPPCGNQVLVRGLSLELNADTEKGLMLAGCNGSGKSSILKCMNQLIHPLRGIVSSNPSEIHYIPTKPYLAEGTLADQVTYPFVANKESDYVQIMEAMRIVKVAYLDERGGGIFFNLSDSWDTKLSLGEQQRLAIARLLFQQRGAKYKYAFLDECTSAVALDGEEEMYRDIASRGLCCVTASQKPWLLQFHSKIIQLSEGSAWELSAAPLDETVSMAQARLPDVVYRDARQQATIIPEVEERTSLSSTPPDSAEGNMDIVSHSSTNRPNKAIKGGRRSK